MMRTGARLLEAFLFALASLLLYHLGPAVLLFLVPLQVVIGRRGTSGLVALPMVLILLAGMRTVQLATAEVGQDALLAAVLEVAMVSTLLAALAVANLRFGGARALLRLLAGTGIVVAGVAVLGMAVAATPAFERLTAAAFGEVSNRMRALASAGEDSVAGTLLEQLLEPGQLRAITGEVLLRSMAPDAFILLTFSWWAGIRAAARVPGAVAAPVRFAGFRLEGWWLWPLIASLGLVGADFLAAGPGELPGWWRWGSAVAWNAALVTLLLFGLQGLAIVRFWFEKRGLPRLLWVVLIAAVVVGLASPRLNIVVALAVPLFGASENWIRWRTGGRTAP